MEILGTAHFWEQEKRGGGDLGHGEGKPILFSTIAVCYGKNMELIECSENIWWRIGWRCSFKLYCSQYYYVDVIYSLVFWSLVVCLSILTFYIMGLLIFLFGQQLFISMNLPFPNFQEEPYINCSSSNLYYHSAIRWQETSQRFIISLFFSMLLYIYLYIYFIKWF